MRRWHCGPSWASRSRPPPPRRTPVDWSQRHGEPVSDPGGGLTHLFPLARRVGETRTWRCRRSDAPRSPHSWARCDGRPQPRTGERPRRVDGRAVATIAGVGPWTRQVIAMRALGDPDAFPESDLGVRHAAELLGLASTPAALVERSQRWRPWRAYAVQYLWSVDDHRINDWPPRRHDQPDKQRKPMTETLTSTIESPIGPLTLDRARRRLDQPVDARAAPRVTTARRRRHRRRVVQGRRRINSTPTSPAS